MINFLNTRDKESTGINKYVAKEKNRLSFNKTSLKLAINYLPNNSYFTLGSMSFRKLTGISMG